MKFKKIFAVNSIILLFCISVISTAQQSEKKDAKKADNSYCYVCHINYQEEKLNLQHEKAGIGCEKCHGLSENHSSDEDGLTPPEKMYQGEKISKLCLSCHPDNKSTLEKPENKDKTCADCHKTHRLENRTRRWNKETGELIGQDSSPAMDKLIKKDK